MTSQCNECGKGLPSGSLRRKLSERERRLSVALECLREVDASWGVNNALGWDDAGRALLDRIRNALKE